MAKSTIMVEFNEESRESLRELIARLDDLIAKVDRLGGAAEGLNSRDRAALRVRGR